MFKTLPSNAGVVGLIPGRGANIPHATQAKNQPVDTYMLTPDKDYGQLVSSQVKMYRPRHGGGYEMISAL